jgi:hypothetical protein
MTQRIRMHKVTTDFVSTDFASGWMPSWTCQHCGRPLPAEGRVMWNAESDDRWPGPDSVVAAAEIIGVCGDACEQWCRSNVGDVTAWGVMPLGEFIFYLVVSTHTVDALTDQLSTLSLSRKLRDFNEEQSG